MKRIWSACLVLVLGGVSLSWIGAAVVKDVLARLEVSPESARDSIWSSLSNGYFSYPYSKKLKQIPVEERAELVGLLGSFARAYTESSDFSQRYAQYREDQKPEPPEAPESVDQQRLAQKAALEQSLKETEASMKTLSAEMQENMKPVLEMLRQQIKELDSPDNPLFNKDLESYQKEAYNQQLQDHQSDLAQWEKDYPEDARYLVRSRLEEFLKETDGIDFGAQLKAGREGKMVFVNPEYEQKSSNWKLAFRVGHETVDAARAFAQQWLSELNGSL